MITYYDESYGDLTYDDFKYFPKGWIAFHDLSDLEDYGECWYFCPKWFWEEYHHMPDCSKSPKVPGFDEDMEYTWSTNMSIEDATEYLKKFGFEILEDVRWF